MSNRSRKRSSGYLAKSAMPFNRGANVGSEPSDVGPEKPSLSRRVHVIDGIRGDVVMADGVAHTEALVGRRIRRVLRRRTAPFGMS